MIKKILSAFLIAVFTSLQSVGQDSTIIKKITPQAIQQRIQKYRMGEITIKAAAGTKIKIQQQSHEFLFGTAIPNHLAENSDNPMTPEERKKYLQILKNNFNYAVHENAMKWYDTEKEPGVVDYSVADRIWELADSLNIPMRGHCVYWAKDEFLMDWLKDLNNDDLRKAIKERAISLINHFEGRIDEFDLNNEMLHGNFFRRRLGYGIISEMAWMVKAQNTEAKLYMNDYGIVDVGYNAGPYANQIEQLLANGVPLDGIGIQAHRSLSGEINNTPYMVQRNLDRFNKFRLPLKITEALFVYDDDETRAAELRKLFPIYFAHPNVEAIVMWGIWEKPHWIPHSAMWKTDFTPTMQAKAYQDLVFGEWWTDTEVTIDSDEEFTIKTFYGNYLISAGDESKELSLQKETGKAVISFEK